MAIKADNYMKYVFNLGISLVPDTITTHFVGGSPITLKSGTFTYGDKGSVDWLVNLDVTVEGSAGIDVVGIAWFPETGPNEEFLPKDHVTILGFPLFVTLFKADYEPVAPFDATKTYQAGDYLRPTTVSVDGKTYAVWTNEAYGTAGVNLYYGKVCAVEGTGADATLVVFFTPVAKVDA